MKGNVFMKSALRQPVRTLLLVLLIGLISFAFISRAVEYLVVTRETDRLAGYYRAIGSLDTGTPKFRIVIHSSDSQEIDRSEEDIAGSDPSLDVWDVTKGAELINDSPYVAFEDRRRSCSGVLQGIYNSDVDGYSSDHTEKNYKSDIHVSDVLFYGELVNKHHQTENQENGMVEEYRFTFQIDRVEAGYPEYIEEGKKISLRYLPESPGELDGAYASLEPGRRYLIKAFYDPGRNGLDWRKPNKSLTLKPLSDEGLWCLPVEPGSSVDWADPNLSGPAEELRVLQENQSAMYIIGTGDMSAMPDMQEASRLYYLAEGRWLDREDDIQSRRVCVVHRDFAQIRGLRIGDTITLKLRNLKAPYCGYIVPGEDWGVWKDYETHTETFEIVGLYGMDPLSVTGTTKNTEMYIPNSLIPAEYTNSWEGISFYEYSFLLRSPEDRSAFLEENRGALEKLGMQAVFVENGWDNFQFSAKSIRRSTAMNAEVFALVLVLALVLSVFLYLRQRRRDFAILRSLGVPGKIALQKMLAPLGLIGAWSIAVGGLLSWKYALEKAAETLTTLNGPEGIAPSAALSPAWLAGLCIGIFVLLLLFTAAGARLMTRRPVLELLQGAAGQQEGRKRKKAEAEQESSIKEAAMESAIGATKGKAIATAVEPFPAVISVKVTGEAAARSFGKASESAGNLGFVHSFRYVFRHIRRAPLKSVLSVSVAMCFTLALGWMSWSMERNEAELDRLYVTTPVDAQIIKSNSTVYLGNTGGGFIRHGTVDRVLESGLIESAYLEAASLSPRVVAMNGKRPEETEETDETEEAERKEKLEEVEEVRAKEDRLEVKRIPLLAFDRPEEFFTRKRTRSDAVIINSDDTIADEVVTVTYAEGWDESMFSRDWTEEWGQGPVPAVLPEELMLRLRLEPGDTVLISDSKAERGKIFAVAGQYTGMIIGSESVRPVLLPLSAMKQLEGDNLLYSFATFVLDPAKNRELPEFREQIEKVFADKNAGVVDLTFLLWDEVLRQVVEPLEQNLSLMAVLYPVTVAVSVLIATGLAALLLFQTAREAALMRVLGTTKIRARAMLSGEQLLLCVLGLAMGLALLAVLRMDISAVLAGPALTCAGWYLAGAFIGAAVGAVSVTNRMPLELLQVKE